MDERGEILMTLGELKSAIDGMNQNVREQIVWMRGLEGRLQKVEGQVAKFSVYATLAGGGIGAMISTMTSNLFSD
uniref:Uncharacterized protein n=1 Tax=Magnetococcus massalia (strain MO-1) TaxID=451514 RepID=A0A1S7LET9_MAGMO|nr:protein of unknown function [Candidatus Magnetococcus massalia]